MSVVADRAQQRPAEIATIVAPPPRRLSGRTGNPIARWTVEILIAFAAFLFIMPVVLIFLTSLKPEAEIIRLDSLLPKQPAVGFHDNFGHIFGNPEEVPIFAGSSIAFSSVRA